MLVRQILPRLAAPLRARALQTAPVISTKIPSFGNAPLPPLWLSINLSGVRLIRTRGIVAS